MNKRGLAGPIVGAALLIGAALLMKYLTSQDIIDTVLSRRIIQSLVGIILLVMGNYMPKTLDPIARERCSPCARQSRKRFVGWAFVLTGLAYIVIWWVAAPDLASVLGKSVVGVCMLLVFGIFITSLLQRGRPLPLDRSN